MRSTYLARMRRRCWRADINAASCHGSRNLRTRPGYFLWLHSPLAVRLPNDWYLNGVAVTDTKPCRGGAAPYRALSRSTSSTLCRDAWRPCCCANWTRPALQCFPVPVCGRAVCDPHGIPPSDGVWTRESRVEGRRRPKKAEVADVVAICVQTSY